MQQHIHDYLSAAAGLALAMLVAGCGERQGGDVSNVARTNDAFIVVTTAETPPFTYRDEKTGEIVGIEMDIIRAAAAKFGRSVEARRMMFEELLPTVKSGAADMAASGISITEPRKADVDFSLPYAFDGGKFLYRAGERMPTMIRAETIRVAVLEATTYDFYLCSHGIDPVRFRSFPEAVTTLKSNAVDAVFNDGIVVTASAKESNGALAASRFETRENFGIAIRKELPELKAALNAIIAERQGRTR